MATSFKTDVPTIKVEAGPRHSQDAHIKPDPDALGASPSALSEDDIYEDAGDLDFAEADQNVFLTRLPKFLWEIWSKLDDEDEIQIGRIRLESQPGEIKRVSSHSNHLCSG